MGERTETTKEESIAERWRDIVRGIRDEYLDPAHRFPWVVGFSGGKDSTVVAHGVFEALLSMRMRKKSVETPRRYPIWSKIAE
jgi:3'-phosphoadenosine 5'-phosphosulfate sulfotransferase (PAPS reductase)/FAD synthetase